MKLYNLFQMLNFYVLFFITFYRIELEMMKMEGGFSSNSLFFR